MKVPSLLTKDGIFVLWLHKCCFFLNLIKVCLVKKLTLSLVWFMFTAVMIRAQSSAVTVTDAVHYYFNKYYFKTGIEKENFPVYESPAATGTAITHVGVV